MDEGGNVLAETARKEHDKTSRAKRVVLQAFNPGENSAQPVISLDAANVKFDPSDLKPDYIGVNADPSADDGDTDWTIFEFTYSGDNVTQIVRSVGSWTDRAA
jgi:hypothetical protein